VYKQAFAALLLGALSFAITSASCVTCPKGQTSCGDAGATGSGGSGDAVKCPMLTAMRTCMTAFCQTATNPYCTCYKRGYDLTTNGCKCIDFDAKKFCDDADDASTYDCGAASSGVSSYCVGVN